MSDEAIKARLRRYLELARRGEAGERENAEKFLARLLARHGLKLEDLDDEIAAKVEFRWPCEGELEQRLLMQVVFTITDASELRYGKVAGRGANKGKTVFIFDMTPGQKLEAELTLAALMPDFRKKADQLLTAFIHTNKLFPASARRDDCDEPMKDPYSAMEIKQIALLMAGMSRTVIPRGAIGVSP